MKGFKLIPTSLNEEKDHGKASDLLKGVIKQLAAQNKEHEKCEEDLEIANKELVIQKEANEKCAEELLIANNDLTIKDEASEKYTKELLAENHELIMEQESIEFLEHKAGEFVTKITHLELEQRGRILELSEMLTNDIHSPEELQTKLGYIKQEALNLEAIAKELAVLVEKILVISTNDEGAAKL